MLDEFSVSKPAGFPDHPHRGFETVTYMLDVRTRPCSASSSIACMFFFYLTNHATRCLLKCCFLVDAGGLHPSGLLRTQGHHQGRGCSGMMQCLLMTEEMIMYLIRSILSYHCNLNALVIMYWIRSILNTYSLDIAT
jgi:hypothetical protein